MSLKIPENPGAVRRKDSPFAHLVAPPEERGALLAAGKPFDAEAWLRDTEPSTPEEVQALDEFLSEREAERRLGIQRQEELLAELDR